MSAREDPPSPLELMVQAARGAAHDAGQGGTQLLERAGSVGVVDLFSWPVPDPGCALAAALGIEPAETVSTARGGNAPVVLLGDLARRISAGELEVALLAAGEAVTPFMRAVSAGRDTGWPGQPEGTLPSRVVGADGDPAHPAELAAGLIAPVAVYPFIEHAARAGAGRSPAAHTEHIAGLWERFAAVARDNPYAWTPGVPAGERIGVPSPGNRLVASPYTKLMTANIQVDQGAALLLCSAGAAQAAGIPRERWVFVHATAGAHDHWWVGEREALHRSPALRLAGEAVLAHADAGIDDVGLLDLYSCFPSAVQVAGAELGVDLTDPARPPTVTGGLTFAGGPANAYVNHSIATLATRLRDAGPGALGLATAVGGYLNEHGGVLLGLGPPAQPFAALDVQDGVDALPRRVIATGAGGRHPIEAYTVLFARDGSAASAIVSVLLPGGERAYGQSAAAEAGAFLLEGDPLGAAVTLDGAGGFAPAS
ncbi:MAG: acetyl-CoA acetyltransferase [Solirubrobacteraceae bacterium]